MKILVSAIVIISILTGCSAFDDSCGSALELRQKILKAESCTFQAQITADYGSELYRFAMNCTADNSGKLQFTVSDPSTIAGITGEMSLEGGALTFDDKVLAFPMLTQLQLTPVSAPWIFLNTLRSGYITGCSEEHDDLLIYIDDSYGEKPLHLQVRIDQESAPYYAEIFWEESRILTLDIQNFEIM